MTAQGVVPRPLLGRVDLLDPAPGRVNLMGSGDHDKGSVPVRNSVENDYNIRIIVAFNMMPRKILARTASQIVP